MNLGLSFADNIHGLSRKSRRKIPQPAELHLESPQNWSSRYHWRLVPIICACMGILAILAGRLWQLQIVEGLEQRQASQANSYALQVVPAPRGQIYDRNGVVLARNESTFRLAATLSQLPTDTKTRQAEINRLAGLLHMSSNDISKRLQEAQSAPFFPVTIKTNLDRDAEIGLLAIQDQLPGITIEQDLRRSYPLGPSLSQVLGYTGSISQNDLNDPGLADRHPGEAIGKAGLEQTYDDQLHGTVGKKFSQVNALGRPQDAQTEQAPQPGDNLKLTIDSALQQQVSQQLADAMQKYNAPGAAAIIQDPQTGQVLSLVSLPSYDNNLFAKGIDATSYQKLLNQPGKPLFDRAIAGTYPPGSMVKPLVAAAAIDNHVITPTTTVNSPSYIMVGNFRYADWTFWEGRAAPGNINVIQAIAQSCDTFFYQIGGGYEKQAGIGVDTLHKYFTQAGLGSLTGIDLPNEASGVSPDPAWKKQMFPDDPNWYVGNTYQLAIGQSYLLATPLQMNNLTAAIANGGHLLQPQLVESISNAAGQTIRSYQTHTLRDQIAGSAGLDIARQGMREAVEHGIVYPFRTNKWAVAAKTGTAEFGTQNAAGQYETHSWVTGYAPYDKPQIAFTILLESGGTSSNAAEVANSIVQWYAEHK